MNKMFAIYMLFAFLIISDTTIPAKADEHLASDGSCDPLCAADVECMSYVETFNLPGEEQLFYDMIRYNAESDLVRLFCIFRVGLVL
jgi:hypothetical protein